MGNFTLQTDTTSITLRADGILHIIFLPETEFYLPQAQALYAAIDTIIGNRKVPFFVDLRAMKKANRASRQYVRQQATQRSIATAVLADSKITQVLSNIYMTVDQPEQPFRIFTDEAEAIDWLISFVS